MMLPIDICCCSTQTSLLGSFPRARGLNSLSTFLVLPRDLGTRWLMMLSMATLSFLVEYQISAQTPFTIMTRGSSRVVRGLTLPRPRAFLPFLDAASIRWHTMRLMVTWFYTRITARTQRCSRPVCGPTSLALVRIRRVLLVDSIPR